MAKSVQKITLSSSRDIPFDKLVLSQSNVRHVKAGVSIEELAEDIARRGLLMGLSVRAVVDESGAETGMFEIPAGGRRYRALALLVKQKRLARNAPVPCVVRTDGLAEEDSLAENIQRAPLHPLDQFRAFLALREKGQSEEEIAASQFVSVAVVKQRLRLASVSPRLLDVYAEDGLTLDQLMAFTVNGDHARQEQVFERLAQSYDKQGYTIRRMLTEGAVRASDKRAQFVGIAAYEEAGGTILNDLFQGDDGGWLQDVDLIDMMVAEKLNETAVTIGAEGWKWTEAAPDFAYGHTYGLRQLRGTVTPIGDEEETAAQALQQELDDLETAAAETGELTDEQDARAAEIETALEALHDRPVSFEVEEVARAGAFVSIAPDGSLRIERGYVRPEDEQPVELRLELVEGVGDGQPSVADAVDDGDGGYVPATPEPEEEDGTKPLSDRLLTELTAYRTLGLRHALGEHPDVAFLAALHALTLKMFFVYGGDSCIELDVKSVQFGSQAPGLNDSALALAIDARHQSWREALPKEPADLWEALQGFDGDSRSALFAHCVAQGVNAVHEVWNRRPRAMAHADRLAQAVDLDMAAAGWTPTVDGYFGRVTKARILQAVAEAKGQRAADRIGHLKKGEMAAEAEGLLARAAWLPAPLRTPGRSLLQIAIDDATTIEQAGSLDDGHSAEKQEDFSDGETSLVDSSEVDEEESGAVHTIAAD